MPDGATGAVEGLEVELLDRLDHGLGEVVLGQPVTEVRGLQGRQQRLGSIACEEVLWHAPMVQNGPDGRGLRDSSLENQMPELSANPTISRYSILGGTP